jgi:uncharacterized RDD family membrane protein YckC
LVTKLLVPVILFILLATGLGLFVIPFVLAALLVVGLIGKVALLEWMGFKVGAGLGGAGLKSPVLALLGGLVILTLLYLVPVVGFVTLALTGMWGLGAAVTAAFGGLRREMPDKSPRGLPPVPEPVVAGATVPGEPSPAVSTRSGPTPEANPLPGTFPHPPLQPAATAASQETATFWERMGAGFLDIVLVGILSGLVGGFPLGLLVGLAYFAGMWTWKGTTIGGIVLGLKVVRVDRRPVTFAVALVRSLAAAFSVVVLFLGFLWIAWDPAKQGWHDKIAGTTVVRSRNGMPLVCV